MAGGVLMRRIYCAEGDPILLAAGEGGDVPREVQVYVEGQWLAYGDGAGLRLTRGHFVEMAANKLLLKDDPPVDREHECMYLGAVAGARGWVKTLRVGEAPGNSELAALYATIEWTREGEEDVREKRFRYVSGGAILGARARTDLELIGAVLDHVSIVKRPFIQGMRPITNSAPLRGSEEHMTDPQLVTLTALGLSPETLTALGLSGAARSDTLDGAILGLSTRATELAARIAELEVEKIKHDVDVAIADFRITPAERPAMIELAKSHRTLFDQIVAARSPHPAVRPPPTLSVPARGTSAASAAIAQYRQEHPGVGYQEAYMACAGERPDLFTQEG